MAALPENPVQALDYLVRQIQENPNSAESYFELGNVLQSASSDMFCDQAVLCWQKALELMPDWPLRYPDWTKLLKTLGSYAWHKNDQVQEGQQILKVFLQIEREIAARHPLGKQGIRILSNYNNPHNFGHQALEMELFVKTGALGWRENFSPILLVPLGAANPTLLNYWRGYVTVVDDPSQIQDLLPLQKWIRHETWYTDLPDGRVGCALHGLAQVQRAWEAANLPPLLKLTDDHTELGRNVLSKWGVGNDDWFVCLHARESGYYGDANSQTGRYRNANIDSYLPAIDAIVERGGWVVRVGDPSMRPLPEHPRVIDYALSTDRSDWMDIFLFAKCKFFVGTCSGAGHVAGLFGAPVVWTNWAVLYTLPYVSQDIVIFKRPFLRSENRLLTMRELATPPYCTATNDRLHSLGYEVIDNEAEDIREAVIEMYEQVCGLRCYSPEEISWQKAMHRIFDSEYSTGSRVRVGSHYMRKYGKELLGPSSTPQTDALTQESV